MAVTDEQKQLVVDSFAKVTAISDKAAELFYSRLWEIAPETQVLFRYTDMQKQGTKLMQTLGLAVSSLYRLESFLPALRELGQRHIAYGVKEEDYEAVGTALIWTLEQGLGDAFTPEVKQAWIDVYGVLSGTATSVYKEVESSD